MEIISIENSSYPVLLRKINNPPQKLYVLGNCELLNSNCISIVGSRKNTEYGEKWCTKFVKELVKCDLNIVSGMAVGIDSIAHKSAIKYGGKTIAVLPSGLDNVYPKQNKNLFNEIISKNGCIISEYSPKESAKYKYFLERNRIVSGLSIATLVVEAGYRSGTSVTARIANNQERDVFCIPGSLDNPKSVGTNKLIREFAKIATSPEDIILNYSFLQKNKRNTEIIEDVEPEYVNIYKLIKNNSININEIVKYSKIELKDVISKLTMLELEGKIKKLPGNMYIRGD